MHLRVFRKNLRFLGIDVDRLIADDPTLAAELSKRCLALLDEGVLPALPITTYPYHAYSQALRTMMNAQHKGKLVLQAPIPDAPSQLEILDEQPFLDPTATYLVTGGFGGFGLRLVSYLAYAGAKHLTLLDRDKTGRRSATWVCDQSGISNRFPDVAVEICRGDVAERSDVERCIAGLTRPLAGVFHAAGIHDDQLWENLNDAAIASVFAGKAHGALHLHEATRRLPLRYFVAFSSVAASLGSPGQVNYSGANEFLHGLSAWRRGQGLPALTCALGGITDAGMAARNAHALRLMKAAGMPAISALCAIANLDRALRNAPNDDYLCAHFEHFLGAVDHPNFMRLGRLMTLPDSFGESSGLTHEAVVAELAAKLVELCGHAEVASTEPLSSYGLNSISVAELGAYLNSHYQVQVSALQLMTTATLDALAEAIVCPNSTERSSGSSDEPTELRDRRQDGPAARKRAGSAFEPPRSAHFPQLIASALTTLPATVLPTPSSPARLPQPSAPAQAAQDPSVVAPLQQRLPDECQQDLSLLAEHITRILAAASPAPAVDTTSIRTVLLTGATGLLGRFLLRDLLRRSPALTIHCLVRGQDKAQATERLVAALQATGDYDPHWLARVQVWRSDLTEPQMGLSTCDFTRLCHEVDAIYHLAADLTLAAPYRTVRHMHLLGIRALLSLALTQRFKHLFFTSTLGVFPQYFAMFANEYASTPIGHQAQPDLQRMKHTMPIGLIGYPWVKLVIEQALLRAQAAGLPIAIFRLPQTAIAGDSGFTQADDIKVRIAMAVVQVGCAPTGFRVSPSEATDQLSALLAHISLNPDRRHTLYHCANPTPTEPDVAFSDLGVPFQTVPYGEFKAACLARGNDSPLQRSWPLVDHFASYWFSEQRAQGQLPISDRAIREDGPKPLRWHGGMTLLARSLQWIRTHQAHWPHAVPRAKLTLSAFQHTMHDAAQRFGLTIAETYPPTVQSGLQQLVAALHQPAAALHEGGYAVVNLEVHRKLRQRAAWVSARRNTVALRNEPLTAPLFILGVNRTGTTMLHRLLALDPRFRAPRPFEIADLLPNCPDPAHDPRRATVADLLTAGGADRRMEGIHPISVDAPEEEFVLLEQAFCAWTFATRYDIPDYAQWLQDNPAHREAYTTHHHILQHLTWQARQAQDARPTQWLLKMPFHLMEMKQLLATYPDARFIQTHRAPTDFLGSWCSLVQHVRELVATAVDPHKLGQQQLAFMASMLERAVAFRAAHPDLESRWFDVSYKQLLASPVQVVQALYEQQGWELKPAVEAAMHRWLAEQAQLRQQEQRHSYSLQTYGLEPATVRGAFDHYLSFVQQRDLSL